MRPSLLAGLLPLGVALACHDEEPYGSVPLDAPVGAAVYVVNRGDASVTVVDLDNRTVAGTIALIGARAPSHVERSPDGARLVVSDPEVSAIFVLDADDGAFVRARGLPAPNHSGVYAPDQSAIFAAQASSPGAVLRLDPETLITQNQVGVGEGPLALTRSLDGAYLFSANHGSDDITVIAPAENGVVTRILVDPGPLAVWPGADAVYVASDGARTIAAIDLASLEITRTFDLGFAPGAAALAPSGFELWVTDPAGARVTFWSLDGTMTGELPTGPGARALAFSPDGALALVANEDDDSLSVIDIPMRAVVSTLITGDAPAALTVRPAPP